MSPTHCYYATLTKDKMTRAHTLSITKEALFTNLQQRQCPTVHTWSLEEHFVRDDVSVTRLRALITPGVVRWPHSGEDFRHKTVHTIWWQDVPDHKFVHTFYNSILRWTRCTRKLNTAAFNYKPSRNGEVINGRINHLRDARACTVLFDDKRSSAPQWVQSTGDVFFWNENFKPPRDHPESLCPCFF